MTWNPKSLLCLASLLAAACTSIEPRTQVMLIADADDTVREQISTLQIQIEGSLEGSTAADATTYMASFDPKDPAGSGWPYRFAMTPRGGAHGRRYKIKLSALDAEDKTIAVLRNEGGFVKGKTLALSMRFEASCLGTSSLSCSEADTCASGKCVNASLDPRALPKLSEIDGGTLPPTGTVNEPVAAAGSGGAGGMSSMGGMGSIQTGTSDCGDGLVGPGEHCDIAIRDPLAQGVCPTECPPQPDRPCEALKLEGSGCQQHCTGTPIMAIVSEDGCCPPGADANSDNDCQAQCGNGKIEKGETCDPPSSCPTIESCVAADACLRPVIVGAASSCDAVCVMEPIDQCVAGDKCCPSICTHMTDSDCSPSCGDGKIDMSMGETCEPSSQTMPCRTDCDDNEPCSRDVLTGSVANCNTRCTHVAISNPFPLDGCCPRGANANNDTDCAPMCGNGVVELGERCDAACPENCDDGNSCTRDTLNGRNCQRQCGHSNIGANANGKDGCCPGGANALTDSDCPAVCGNGAIEGDERCDGACPTPQTCNDNLPCTTDVITGSGCQRQCVHNDIGPNPNNADGCCPSGMNRRMDADCPPAAPVCGNNEVETGELCDGNCPTQQTCADDNPCTRDEVTGQACQRKCANTPISASTSGADGCCPTNTDRWQDSDCEPRCPNGHTEPGEKCDGTDCPTQASCNDDKPCTTDGVTGSPCQRECVHNDVGPNPTTTDGCCPTGLFKPMDADCPPAPPMCGNGVKETGEKCDGNDCPTPASCNDDKPCTADVITGTLCQRECVHNDIGAKPTPADSCCPPGTDRWEDADCAPKCGNSHVEGTEDCDPPNLTTCSATCTTIVPPPPTDGGLPP